MKDERQRIIETLQHKNLLTSSLGRDAMSMVKKTLAPIQFIEKVTRESTSEDCLRCNGQPFCDLFLAFAYLELSALNKAQSLVERAITGFRMRGLNWNQALSHWLLGVVFLQKGDNESAERSLQKSLGILTELLKEFRLDSNYKQAKECEDHIKQIQKALKGKSSDARKEDTPSTDIASSSAQAVVNPKKSPAENTAYIAIPWIPIYTQMEVEASIDRPARTGQDIKQKSQMETVNLEGKLYTIHSIRFGNKRIILSRDKQYAWVKVHGHSMNDAKPTTIDENDYVLFYESNWPDRNEIVIASKRDSSAAEDGFSHMVKRYSKEEQQLKSETSKKGDQYAPVDITDEYRCVGVVVAVAKLEV